LAMPKKTVTPWPPQRVESASGGVPKQLSMTVQWCFGTPWELAALDPADTRRRVLVSDLEKHLGH
jgi:hypothetical protein